MRLRLIISDREYCEALAQAISVSDFDVYVEMGSRDTWAAMDNRTIIVTDVDYKRVERDVLEQYRNRIVFLSVNSEDHLTIPSDKPYCIFKYRSVSNILSDIAQVNYLLTGETLISNDDYMSICVCSNYTSSTGLAAKAVARQLIFRKDISILILSLNFINEYGTDEETDNRKYSRLMYYMDLNKDFAVEGFTYRDSYGISYLRLPKGLNPLAYMNYENLNKLISCMCNGHFDVVIFNIESNYTMNNIKLMNSADNMLFLSEDDSRFSVLDLIENDELKNRLYTIYKGITGENVELRIDDYVRKLCEIKE